MHACKHKLYVLFAVYPKLSASERSSSDTCSQSPEKHRTGPHSSLPSPPPSLAVIWWCTFIHIEGQVVSKSTERLKSQNTAAWEHSPRHSAVIPGNAAPQPSSRTRPALPVVVVVVVVPIVVEVMVWHLVSCRYIARSLEHSHTLCPPPYRPGIKSETSSTSTYHSNVDYLGCVGRLVGKCAHSWWVDKNIGATLNTRKNTWKWESHLK